MPSRFGGEQAQRIVEALGWSNSEVYPSGGEAQATSISGALVFTPAWLIGLHATVVAAKLNASSEVLSAAFEIG